MFKDLKHRDCQTHPLRWLYILQDIYDSPTVERVSIVDVQVVSLNVAGDKLSVSASFDELGAALWVGSEEIRKSLEQTGHRIVQRWGHQSDAAAQATQAARLPNPLAALPMSNQ